MLNSESDLYKYQEFKFRKVEYWLDDNSPDDNMLFVFNMQPKTLKDLQSFLFQFHKKNIIQFHLELT